MKHLLIIGHTFPEPNTTAAGSRMMQLINLFLEDGFNITFATTASITPYTPSLSEFGIQVKNILLNDASFDEFVSQLQPSVVLFDRYITEEQFGWRVSEQCPNALKILDTEDLHFLRIGREIALKNGTELNLFSDATKRELASILRCDVSLIISKAEMELLVETFKIPEGLLYYLPFLVTTVSQDTTSFEARQHFISIANFQHAPNTDAVIFLKKEIWPKIKKQLPAAELHIYGAYASKQISELHNENEGFLLKGWAEDVAEVMQQSRVNLAPLRFGAGLKGKLLDAAQFGTPSVSTSVGVESMEGIAICEDEVDAFIASAVKLYSDKEAWEAQQRQAYNVLEQEFSKSKFASSFIKTISQLQQTITKHRERHFIGQVLQHQSAQATKYMSKWIEEKNKKLS